MSRTLLPIGGTTNSRKFLVFVANCTWTDVPVGNFCRARTTLNVVVWEHLLPTGTVPLGVQSATKKLAGWSRGKGSSEPAPGFSTTAIIAFFVL